MRAVYPQFACRTVLGIIITLVASGCGPSELLKNPSGWPAEWQGRRLYNTPSAYIYASTDSAAGEAERVTQSVAREIASRRGEPGKGLVVVTDVHDALVTTD